MNPLEFGMSGGSAPERKLRKLFAALAPADRDTLLAFAEFLAAREAPTDAGSLGGAAAAPGPLDIPRPEEESVVGAIKRLSATYPMLDKDKVLHETAGLMAQHVMQGRDSAEVIDELEAVFERHYRLVTGQDESA